jgi:hypothetical protein
MAASIVYALLVASFSFSHLIGASHIVALNVTTLSSIRLPKPLSDGTAVLQTKVIYLHGGCDSPNGNQFQDGNFSCNSISNASYAFLLNNLSFVMLPDMPTPRYRHAAVALQNQILLVGGRSVTDQLIATVDVRTGVTSVDVLDAFICFSLSFLASLLFPPRPSRLLHRYTIFHPNSGPRTTWQNPTSSRITLDSPLAIKPSFAAATIEPMRRSGPVSASVYPMPPISKLPTYRRCPHPAPTWLPSPTATTRSCPAAFPTDVHRATPRSVSTFPNGPGRNGRTRWWHGLARCW